MEAYDVNVFLAKQNSGNGGKWEQMPKDIQWHMIGHVQTINSWPFCELNSWRR
jgi:uncharacterized pyridoxal phosphate-containing UPF0001 family protein